MLVKQYLPARGTWIKATRAVISRLEREGNSFEEILSTEVNRTLTYIAEGTTCKNRCRNEASSRREKVSFDRITARSSFKWSFS